MGDEAFDLLVIGGGINGAGIARDAAMRGLSVCLVEKEDYGAGTSSRSSMLAHGGLRYLEQFELGLVHQALQDREIMFRQAPHLVQPVQFVYPLYPHIASRRTVRAGMWLYDLLSHGKSVPGRQHLRRDDVIERLPGIRTDGLLGGATYHDGQWRSVERFVSELVISARRHGAVCLNHTRVTGLAIEDGICTGAWAAPDAAVPEAALAIDAAHPAITRDRPAPGRDAPDQSGDARDTHGSAHASDVARGPADASDKSAPSAPAPGDGPATWRIHARATINAAGPWVDRVLHPDVPAPRLIRGTKGSHIVVPRFVETALIIRAKDGRTFFILPWDRHCIVGTTDTDYGGDPGDAAATPEEVAYLQESARWYFPDAPLDTIRWTYAGVRPLVHEEGLTESHVTRRHRLHDHTKEGTAQLWSVQGGKLTTYRHLSEEAVDWVCQKLGRRELARTHPTRTGSLPGGPLVPWDTFRPQAIQAAMAQHGLGATLAAHLVDTYGARWRSVAEQGNLERIVDDRPWMWCEVDHAVRAEQAVTLRDVMLRRTQIGLAPRGRPKTAKAVAKHMAGLLGWDGARVRREVAAYKEAVGLLAVPGP